MTWIERKVSAAINIAQTTENTGHQILDITLSKEQPQPGNTSFTAASKVQLFYAHLAEELDFSWLYAAGVAGAALPAAPAVADAGGG